MGAGWRRHLDAPTVDAVPSPGVTTRLLARVRARCELVQAVYRGRVDTGRPTARNMAFDRVVGSVAVRARRRVLAVR